MSSKIDELSHANSNIQKEISSATESLSTTLPSRSVLPFNTTQTIADELADHIRKKNSTDCQADKDSFGVLCTSVFNTEVKIVKLIRLGKKVTNKHKPAMITLDSEESKSYLPSHSYLLRHKDQYKDVFISPDRTRFEKRRY